MPVTPIPVFTTVTGINNKLDPARILYDPKHGVAELASAVNVEVDASGRVKRRKGYQQVRSDDAHSLFAVGDTCLYVSADSLYKLNSDYTRTGIRSGMTPELPMSYAFVDGKIYHCNGADNGVYWTADERDHAWLGDPYVGPTSKFQISLNPPMGEMLSLMDGYMLIGVDNLIYFSMQFAYSWYRLSRDLVQLPGKLTMMMAVCGGVWVSTEEKTYFIEGTDPMQWKLVDKANYPAIKGTAAYYDYSMSEKLSVSGPSVIWTSTKGICAGDADGNFKNITYEKLTYPSARSGAGITVNNQYIVSLRP